jgi:adenylylsulfate kinase-like enzyme
MRLIFLHGPPAAGKLTIAQAVSAQTGWGVFHNHLTIDAARPFFEFGTEEFWQLTQDLRLRCLQFAARHSAGTVITTGCYDHPKDLALYEQMEEIVTAPGGQVLPVYLQCAPAELERRVCQPSRAALGKVHTVKGLHDFLKRWNCVAIPRDNCVTLITDDKTPEQCAAELIETFRVCPLSAVR